ncbi:MAG: transporter substrate-binding domain-containing protein [Bacteroidaceae bacterium]|nr:transporter substrate-binding domain-containing protein [Bacteroidaceae bacterium]
MKRKLLYSMLPIALLLALFSCCEPTSGGRIDEIKERGTLFVGSTGDYRPLSYREPDTQEYWGFDVELAEMMARDLGVKVQYVPTSWPTLTQDMLNEQLFDLALCGISITDARKEIMLMSEGYLHNGKTILCRTEDAQRFQTLDDMNRPDVTVMVNPGGLNEKFANEHLTEANIVVHQQNEEIPSLVAEGKADIMITEIVEAPYYVQHDARLAAPLIDKPFTSGQIGVLMRKGDDDLLQRVNAMIDRWKKDGTLKRLHEQYGFNYDF